MRLSGILAATLLANATALVHAALPWEPGSDLRSLATVGGNYGTYLVSSYCLDGCRYDRSSVDPGKGSQRFIRIEDTPRGTQGVIFDQPGAGAVTRIWMTTGDGHSTDLPSSVRLLVYVDGAATPAIDSALDAFFRDPNAQIASASAMPPLATERTATSGGNVSYRTITYRSGLKIALLNGVDTRLWYQIDYTQVPLGTPLTSFDGDETFSGLRALLGTVASRSNVLGGPPVLIRERTIVDVDPIGETTTIAGTDPVDLLDLADGAGWITSMRIGVAPARWNDVLLSMRFDGETTVDVPVTEFFTADSLQTVPSRGVLAGVDTRGAFYSRIPLPFRSGATVSLRLSEHAEDASPVQVRARFEVDDEPPGDAAGTFHVTSHFACPTQPSVTGDEVLLEHHGAGRLIGLSAWMSTDGALGGGYYLEGDERVYLDGSTQPLRYGTGVEDAFDGGFYFDAGAYSAPLAGAPFRHASPGADDATSMYRWFLTDAMAWRSSIVYKLESGATGTQPMCLRTLAYYYAQPAPTQVRLAVLDLDDPAAVAASGYAAPARNCSIETGQFGDEPPTEATRTVCSGPQSSTFTLEVPTPATAFRLRRTFDASVAGQAAAILVNGRKVGAWGDVQANPARRWSQLDVDFELALPAPVLVFEIRPEHDGAVSESRYELWGSAR